MLAESTIDYNIAGINGGGLYKWGTVTMTLDETSHITNNTPDDIWPA